MKKTKADEIAREVLVQHYKYLMTSDEHKKYRVAMLKCIKYFSSPAEYAELLKEIDND